MAVRHVETKVEARVILNPVRDDGTFSVDTDYVPGNFPLEASSCAMTFGINMIPTASVTLVSGRRDSSSVLPSLAQIAARRVVRKIDVLIEVKLTGKERESYRRDRERGSALGGLDSVRRKDWPDTFFTIFDGYTTSAQLVKSINNASYKLGITHWLGRLTESSVLSASLHPSAPGLLFNVIDPQVAPANANVYTLPLAELERARKDLWGKGILPGLRRLAEHNQARVDILDELENLGEEQRTAAIRTLPGNRAALEALDRFGVHDPEGPDDELGIVPPLELQEDLALDTVDAYVDTALYDIIVRDARHQDTFWDRIIRAASHFQFSVIPLVNRAVCVPMPPSGSRTTWLFIPASEVFTIQSSNNMRDMPRGVVLYSPEATSLTGVYSGFLHIAPSAAETSGVFDLRKTLEREIEDRTDLAGANKNLLRLALQANADVAGLGKWLFRPVPHWLSDFDAFPLLLSDSLRKDEESPPSMSHMYGKEEKTEEKQPPNTTDQDIADRLGLGKRYAQTVCLDELLRDRVAVISTRFRDDIAPGSTVRFESTGRTISNLPGSDTYVNVLQGLVNQVTLQIDAETATLATVLTVTHVKNESEIMSLAFSPYGHPLYTWSWVGQFLTPRDENNRRRSLYTERLERAPIERLASFARSILQFGEQAIESAKSTAQSARAFFIKLIRNERRIAPVGETELDLDASAPEAVTEDQLA